MTDTDFFVSPGFACVSYRCKLTMTRGRIQVVPSQLKIGGLLISVRFDPTLAAERDAFGEFSSMKQVITVDGQIPPDRQEETLLHEILEALNTCYGLELSHGQLTTLGMALHQVLSENKLVFGAGRGG